MVQKYIFNDLNRQLDIKEKNLMLFPNNSYYLNEAFVKEFQVHGSSPDPFILSESVRNQVVHPDHVWNPVRPPPGTVTYSADIPKHVGF